MNRKGNTISTEGGHVHKETGKSLKSTYEGYEKIEDFVKIDECLKLLKTLPITCY